MPSRLFIYYNERFLEGTVNQDAGAAIGDGAHALNMYGACSEESWPYDAPKFTTKPSVNCFTEASQCKVKSYYRMDTTGIVSDHVKAALISGFPVVTGFTVYASFESEHVTETGLMPIPLLYEKIMGGHCVVIVGCDDNKKAFFVRNSWGTSWGCNANGNPPISVSSNGLPINTSPRGYFWMPYDFVNGKNVLGTPYCTDFWVISSVTDTGPANADANILKPVVINLNQSSTSSGVVNPKSS